jgi:transcription initiation factor TFIIB
MTLANNFYNSFLDSTRCPECQGTLIYDSKTYSKVCNICGLVYSHRNLVSNKKNAYNHEERTKKIHSGPFFELTVPSHLATDFDPTEALTQKSRQLFQRLHRVNNFPSSFEKTLYRGLNKLNHLTQHLDTPSHIKLDAYKLFLQAKKKNLILGRTIKEIITACVFLSYKKQGKPLLVPELLHISDIQRRKLIKYSRLLAKEFGITLTSENLLKLGFLICSKFNLCFDTIQKILHVLKQIKKIPDLYLGRNTRAIIGAVIFLILKREKIPKLSQVEIASRLALSHVTLKNNRYRIEKYISPT